MTATDLRRSIRKTIGIRRGEEDRVLLMFLYIFLVITSLMVVKPVAASLFLSTFGASRLPYGFILVSLCAASVASLYGHWLQRIDLMKLMVRTLQATMISLMVFWAAFQTAAVREGMLFLFYVWVAVFGLIAASQFWILANCIFNPREAKRLFGIVGSGAIAGSIAGGYLTKILAPSAGSANLLLLCTGLLGAAVLVTQRLHRVTAADQRLLRIRQREHSTRIDRHPARTIWGSRHLLLLAVIVGIGVLAGKLVEWQFSAVAVSRIDDPDRLTAFFGFWLSSMNVVSLFVQLFATRRVVGLWGVGVSLFFLPVFLLAGSVLILLHPALWTAVFLKVGDGSMKNSINKAGLELMALPIPAEIKAQTKAFIDVMVDSGATGLGGILVLVLNAAAGMGIRPVAIMTAVLAVVWLVLVVRIRREYVHAFRRTLVSAAGEPKAPPSPETGDSAVGHLAAALEGSDEEQVLASLRMAKSIQHERLVPVYKRLLGRHTYPAIRLEALRSLYVYRDVDVTGEARGILTGGGPIDADPELKTEAIHYLFQNEPGDRVEMLRGFLRHADETVSGAALLCAARESRRNRTLKKLLRIEETTRSLLEEIPRMTDPGRIRFTKVNCCRVIGAGNIPRLIPYLHIFLHDTDRFVQGAAITAAGESRDPEFVPLLIEKVGEPEFETVCRNALRLFGGGILSVLSDCLGNPLVDRRVRERIPLALSMVRSQAAVDALIDHLGQGDPGVRFEIIRALNRLRGEDADLRFDEKKIVGSIFSETKRHLNLLTALYHQISRHTNGVPPPLRERRQALASVLENRLDQNLERIFRLLGLRYPARDILEAYRGLQSDQPDIRVNAVEFLDNVLETNLKRTLIPIVETSVIDAVVEQTLDRLGLKIPSELNALELVLPESDPELQLRALDLISVLGDPRYAPLAGEMVSGGDPRVREAAERLLRELGYLSAGSTGGMSASI